MNSIINVPQGYCARYQKTTIDSGISGLFTSEFSSCNIVACISETRFVLMHVDNHTSMEKVLNEVAWAGESVEVVIIYKYHAGAFNGHIINNRLMQAFNNAFNISVRNFEVTDEQESILLSFQRKESAIHPNIRSYEEGQKPDGLITHPDEQRFFAVQKIQQLIGVRARQEGAIAQGKKFSIFDGRNWERLGDVELKIDDSHPNTRSEMEDFHHTDPLIKIREKLEDLIRLNMGRYNIEISTDDQITMACDTMTHLEGYLNNFEINTIFNRNIVDMINSEYRIPKSEQDNSLKAYLSLLASSNEDRFLEIENAINHYTPVAPETNFKQKTLREYRLHVKHYHQRKYYVRQDELRVQANNKAGNYGRQAAKDYVAGNFLSAAALYKECIKLYSISLYKDDPRLATAYYNLGRCLFRSGNYTEAYSSLKYCLDLRENNTAPPPSHAEREKTRIALEECARQMSVNSQEVVSHLAINR